jgi:hypothetical protein
MRKLALLALSSVLFILATNPRTVTAQTTCSCPWQVTQGDNSGFYSCEKAHSFNETNLKSYAAWLCGRTPCATAYTPLSCSTRSDGYNTASGLLNYKCC